MTSEQKIKSVEDQFVLLDRGEINALSCPYCSGIFAQGEPACCTLMAHAINAVLDRVQTEDLLRQAEEIAYRAGQEEPLVRLN